MSDGIIQRMFNKVEAGRTLYENFDYYTINQIEQLQRELIIAIKQELNDYDIDIIRILIGDKHE